jgi:hypothetical protein
MYVSGFQKVSNISPASRFALRIAGTFFITVSASYLKPSLRAS